MDRLPGIKTLFDALAGYPENAASRRKSTDLLYIVGQRNGNEVF